MRFLSSLIFFLFFLSLSAQDDILSPLDSNNIGGFNALQYRLIGPFRGGRSCAVTGVPGKPNLFYFGATGGGVWRTTNGGRNWTNLSDGFFGGSVGSIAVSQDDPNVIYVGGGEKTVRGNVSHGYGVWKSEDAGKTWMQKGLKDSRHIARIRIHPRNHQIVYAAVMGNLYKSHSERGVYKSIDGGNSWEKVLFVNDEVGAVDLIIDPSNPRILYASTWRVRRTPYSLSSGGEGSGLWKSTDGGENWTNLNTKPGLPTDTLGIIGIAVSPVNSNRVWALIESKTGGLFRSEDGGDSWRKINDDRNIRQRAWYYTRIYADPEDEDILYVMNVRYHKSKDGGRSFKQSAAPHGDHHDLWIAPEDPDRMIIGDDGGAQITYDGGATWSTYHNQPTAQFYRVTTDAHFPYRIYAAQQDNSTVRIAHRSSGYSIGEDDWEPTAGCECGHIAIDPLDNEIVYGGCYDGYLQRKNHRTDQSQNVSVWPDNPMGYGAEGMRYRFQWNFPIFFSPHNPKKLYAASNQLHVSTDQGKSWRIISPDLTRNDSTKLGPSGGPITKDNTSVEYYCTIFAAAESPREEGVLWAGSDDGLVHISRDGGQNWTNVTPTNLPEWSMINSIEVDPHRNGGLYLAATRYKLGDFTPLLYRTTNYGQSWQRINNGIRSDHFTRVVRADPEVTGLLYAGTESGLYVSYDDGANWQNFQLNLPIVPITDLTIKNDHLIVATQGRSLWILDNLEIVRQWKPSIRQQAFHLFQPQNSYRMNGGQSRNPGNAGSNHPAGVPVFFYLKDTMDTRVSLQFLTSDNQLIRRFATDANEKKDKLKVEKGANRFIWNMRYPDAKTFDKMILWWASMSGPLVVPGSYKVRMVVGQDSSEHTFNVLKDPRSETTLAEFEEQFEFLESIRTKVSEAHAAIEDIRAVRSQFGHYRAQLKKDSSKQALVDMAQRIDSLMTEVEESLYQTKNRSPQDPLNFPIKLTNKLGHLRSISEGNFPPTAQAKAVRDELVGKIDEQLDNWKNIKDQLIPAFNQRMRELQVDAIYLKE